MDKESKHAKTSELSRNLCELLFAELSEDSNPRLDSSPNVCGVHIEQRKSALYWLYHSQKSVRIYLDCDDTEEIRGEIERRLPSPVRLQTRPFPRKGFALRTPIFFDIQSRDEVQGLGPLLKLLSGYRRDRQESKKSELEQYWLPNSEETFTSSEIVEGARISILTNRYERSQLNRERCIQAYGTLCAVCGFNFLAVYGEIGKGYIHVHHLSKLATPEGKSRKINPVKDLRPVCPNCHQMLHRTDPPYTIEQLIEIISTAKKEIEGAL